MRKDKGREDGSKDSALHWIVTQTDRWRKQAKQANQMRFSIYSFIYEVYMQRSMNNLPASR